MNVKKLIEELSIFDPETEILLAMDAEGNGYSMLRDFGKGTIRPEEKDNWYIEEYFSDKHSDDDCCLEPGERENFIKVICLWP